MITNQNRKELIAISKAIEKDVYASMSSTIPADFSTTPIAGVYKGPSYTDVIWTKSEHDCSFFFVSPCIRHGRAETFITSNGDIEVTLHLVNRYMTRNSTDKIMPSVVGDMEDRERSIALKSATFFMSEQILGKLAVTKERGDVLRTTHGLLLCSEKTLHDGIKLANTFVSDRELIGSQKEAVKLWDEGFFEEAKRVYETYFTN